MLKRIHLFLASSSCFWEELRSTIDMLLMEEKSVE